MLKIKDNVDLKELENILSEREQDKARIKELEEENIEKDLKNIGIKEDVEANTREIIERYYTPNEKCIPKRKVKEILDKAEAMDYYTLPDVIDDLTKLLEAEDE